MTVQSISQDCYPGRERYVARVRCDQCGVTIDVAGEGHATEHRARKIIAEEWCWTSETDQADTRKRKRSFDYCSRCIECGCGFHVFSRSDRMTIRRGGIKYPC